MKKILSVLLVVIMVFFVASCNVLSVSLHHVSETQDSGDTGSSGTTTPGTSSSVTTTKYTVCPIPPIDFQDKELSLFAMVQSNVNECSFDARYDGNVVNNAVFQRNKNIKDRLNCQLNIVEQACDTNDLGEGSMLNVMEAIKETPTYHVVTAASFQMVRLAEKGLLHDLNSRNIEYLDLNRDCYDDSYNNAYSVGGRQYLVSGKMDISWYRYQQVIFFNRNFFNEKYVQYPYQLVLDGEWTLEKMATITSNFRMDDGDKTCNQADTYGYYTFVGAESAMTDGYLSAFDLHLVKQDETDYFTKAEVDPTAWQTKMGALFNLLNEEFCWAGRSEADGGNSDGTADSNQTVTEKFLSLQTAMITHELYLVEKEEMIQMGRDLDGYGILPLPKANQRQERYISHVQSQVHAFGIPYTMVEKEYICAQLFLDAFAVESCKTTMPAYYERALTKKYVGDKTSYEMIKIIDSNVMADIGSVYTASLDVNPSSFRTVFTGQDTVLELLNNKVIGENAPLDTAIAELNRRYEELDALLEANGYVRGKIRG